MWKTDERCSSCLQGTEAPGTLWLHPGRPVQDGDRSERRHYTTHGQHVRAPGTAGELCYFTGSGLVPVETSAVGVGAIVADAGWGLGVFHYASKMVKHVLNFGAHVKDHDFKNKNMKRACNIN